MKNVIVCLLAATLVGGPTATSLAGQVSNQRSPAKNVILFIGDGMGVSTVTAARAFTVGIGGRMVIDHFPYTALSRVFTSDHITPDSAGTMTAMMSGYNTNNGVIGYPASTERADFNADGDGQPVATLLEMARAAGMKTGVVTTARSTHATPAATYAHIHDRNFEDDIAVQASTSNLDVLMGGGRRHFDPASRDDGRDVIGEMQTDGYTYVSDEFGLTSLGWWSLPVLGLFSNSHMAYEYDRGGTNEPSLSQMTAKAVELLEGATADFWSPDGSDSPGYFLMVESGRIDHAHHAGNAYRALSETEEFDRAILEAVLSVDLNETLVIVTADHSHVFNIAGYPLRAADQLPYSPTSAPGRYLDSPSAILDLVYDINTSGEITASGDSDGVPYAMLGYGNGPGARGRMTRVDPTMDSFLGLDGEVPPGPTDPEYLQEATVPLGSETHSAEEVAIYAVGPGAEWFRGTVKNTWIFHVMRWALQL